MAIESFQSDDFNGVALDPRWTFVNPLGDGSLLLSGTGTEDAYLELSVPAGVDHDLWRTDRNAVRAMQAATDDDFNVEVKFASEPVSKWQMQGILIEQDDSNWLRFDISSNGSSLRIFAGETSNGKSKKKLSTYIPAGSATYLRVDRQGDVWTLEYSADGVSWTAAGSFTHALNVISVGTFAGNAGKNLPAFTAQIDYFFNSAAPILPEDGVVVEPPPNSVPDAVDDVATVAPSSDVTINVLANDNDADGSLVVGSVTVVDGPIGGMVIVNSDGTITYSNIDPLITSDSFTYTVEDNDGEISNTATVTLTIAEPPPNVVPLAGDDSATVVRDSDVTISVLTNDSDVDGTLVTNTVTVLSGPSNGIAVVNGDGTITYSTTNSIATSDSFTYTVEDNSGGISNEATVNVTIAEPPPNVAPEARDDVAATLLDSAVSINVLANDSDTDGALVASTVTVVGAPSNGSYTVDPNTGEIIYSPNLGFTGTDNLTYVVSDDDGAASNVATTFITVGGEGPLIDVWYGLEQEFGQIGLPQTWVNILGNVSDIDGVTSLSYSLNGGESVVLSIGDDGRRLDSPGDFNIDIAYADLDGSSVDDFVTITATDALGNVSTQTVTIDYEAGNIWPEQYSVDWSTAGSIQDVAQVVDGKWAIEADGLRISEPGYDRLVAIGDVSWTDYEVTVPITIHSMRNTSGIGIAVRWTGHTDNPVSGFQPKTGWQPLGAIGWFRNRRIGIATTKQTHNRASDKSVQAGSTYNFKFRVEGAGESLYSLKVWEVGQPEPSSWDVQYTEDASRPQNGSAMLLTHLADVTFGNVTITQIGSNVPNQNPVANDDTVVAETTQAITVDVLSNDGDSDGTLNASSVAVINGPNQGTATVNSDGTITYTHAGTEPGADSFTYTVDDNDGATSDPATVNISIENPLPNQAPTAANDNATVDIADDFVINVLSNDSDSDGSLVPGSVAIVSTPSEGTATINSDGTITYAHTGTGAGLDSFTYTVNDDDGAVSNEATVNVTIEEASGLAFESDDFSDSLLGQQWTVVDPVGNSSYQLENGGGEAYLELAVPQGTEHDAWQTNDSVRAMQVASNEDFEIEAKFLSEPSTKYQLQGILVEQDANNWIRFDTYHDGKRLRVFSAVTIDGVSQTQIRNRIDSGEGAYLRVNRQGDTWSLEHSADGVTWQTAGSFSHSLIVNSVGTFAGNSGSAPAFAAQVDYFFNTVAPIAPEDDGIAGISITETGGSTEVVETDGADSYSIALAIQPESDVIIEQIVSDGRVVLDNTILTFTPDNWNLPQTVSVETVNGLVIDEDVTSEVNFTISSSDALYNDLQVSAFDVGIRNTEVPIRINVGGDSYIDSSGTSWSADSNFVDFGGVFVSPWPVEGSIDSPLHQTERYGKSLSYEIPVANGVYDVNLLFVENKFTKAGKRVFDVSIEDELVIDDFDLWDTYQILDRLIPRQFEDITVTDGVLELDFQATASNAFTLAIEVLKPGLNLNAQQPGNDVMTGGESNDTLDATFTGTQVPGKGEVDVLTGAGGIDTFVLGSAVQPYYDDGLDGTSGLDDYALITDFSVGQQDVIQLHGNPADYDLVSAPQGLPSGTAIVLNTYVQPELIGIIQGTTNVDIASPLFTFI
ncbi:MAG: tandem-95 repeat protein [Cyanobacteria bacterium P01_F01_bin.150]